MWGRRPSSCQVRASVAYIASSYPRTRLGAKPHTKLRLPFAFLSAAGMALRSLRAPLRRLLSLSCEERLAGAAGSLTGGARRMSTQTEEEDGSVGARTRSP